MQADPFLLHLSKLPRSPETLRSYECKVGSAMKACGCSTVRQLVSAPDKSYKCLEGHYPVRSTLKQTLTAILATIGSHKKWCEENPGKQGRWRTLHSALSKALHAPGAKPMTVKTMAKYVCWKEILGAARRAVRHADAHSSIARSLETVLLALVTSLPPKRSDYGEMLVVQKESACAGNCLVVGVKPRIVISDHKTSKSHGKLVEPVPKALMAVMSASLAAWPRKHLFVVQQTMRPLTPDGFGSFVKRTMLKHVGKPVGVTMLRHIFVSDVVDKMEPEQKTDMARRMLHSSSEQAGYVIRKPDGSALC